jgi:hypothetical protein
MLWSFNLEAIASMGFQVFTIAKRLSILITTGIVVVEGLLEDVIEYVRRIQRLRWQHMVVRGEEIETIEVSPGDSIDDHRKFPEHFQEIDGNMSDLGALCRQANLHELFMTALKKTTSQG